MKKRFRIFMALAVTSIFISFILMLFTIWSNSEEMIHLRVSAGYYLALGVIYIFMYIQCKYIYTYIYVYPMTFILQILCFIRLKYSIISGSYGVQMFYQYNTEWGIAGIINIIMLIGCIQYFIVLRRHNKDKKIKKG